MWCPRAMTSKCKTRLTASAQRLAGRVESQGNGIPEPLAEGLLTVTPAAVAEPTSLALIGSGVLAAVARRARMACTHLRRLWAEIARAEGSHPSGEIVAATSACGVQQCPPGCRPCVLSRKSADPVSVSPDPL